MKGKKMDKADFLERFCAPASNTGGIRRGWIRSVRILGELHAPRGTPVAIVSYRRKYPFRDRPHTSYAVFMLASDRVRHFGPIMDTRAAMEHHAYNLMMVRAPE